VTRTRYFSATVPSAATGTAKAAAHAAVFFHSCDDRIIFHVIGNGFERSADTPPNLHYHGPKPYEELGSWLAAMDVGLCCYNPGPADYCSPLKVFDYMASGLTIVSTPQPQVNEIFGQLNQRDLLVEGNARAMADMLMRLANDRGRLRQQGAAGRKLAVEQYNWRRAAKDTFDAIEQLRRGTEPDARMIQRTIESREVAK